MSLHQSSGRWQLGFSLALATALLWGVLPIALKVVLQAMDVYTVTWFRFLMSFGLLALILRLRGALPTGQRLRSAGLKLLAIATVFLAINYLCFLQGLNLTTPANSQVIIQCAPVFFGIGALLIFRERYNLSQWLGLSVLTAGMSLFFNDQLQALVAAPQTYLWGTAILVVAAITWAVYAIAQKQLLLTLSSAEIMLVIYGGSALLFTPAATPSQVLTLTPLQGAMLLFSGLNTLLAYGAFAEALDHWEASRVSAVLSLTPIITLASVFAVSAVFPRLIQPEQMTLMGLIGAVLVVAGSLALALGRDHRPKPMPTAKLSNG